MCEPGSSGHRGRGSFGELISNWREYDAPAGTKLRLAARNYLLRLKNRSLCCGNDGEPGC